VSEAEAVADTAGTSARPEPAFQQPAPYVHDPALVPALARLVDAACQNATDPHEASMRMPALAAQAVPSLDRPTTNVLIHTLLYTIEVNAVDAPLFGASLAPLKGLSLLPVALRDAGDEINKLWSALASAVTHPIARARCWDIVFTLGLASNGRDSAGRAVRAYLDTGETALAPRHRAHGLVRAWTIARQVGLVDLTQKITTAMIDVVEDALTRQDDPYAAIPLLGALIAPARRGKPTEAVSPAVDDLLDRALTTYPQIHVIKDIATLVRKRANGDAARAARASRYEVRAMLAEAEAATDPMIIRTLFNDAAATARRLGVTDLEKVAIARLQAAPPLSWDSTPSETTIPGTLFDMYLPGFNQASDWRRALKIWLTTTAPTGRREANEATARQVKEVSVIRYRIRTVLFRDGDLPARSLSSEDDHFERDLARVESQHMSVHGQFLAKALYLIRVRFGIPPHGELKAFLMEFDAAPTLVSALATALHLYWVGEYEASTHLAVPRVEAAARALLLELNEPVYRVAVGDATGQFPGLGSLLPELVNNDFDPDWERFLRVFLLNEGSNLRNLVAHGFVDAVDPVTAALALRASAVLILLATEQTVNRDATTVRAVLATPHGSALRRNWWRRFKAALWAARHELQR
jgi:hypothetical protein